MHKTQFNFYFELRFFVIMRFIMIYIIAPIMPPAVLKTKSDI